MALSPQDAVEMRPMDAEMRGGWSQRPALGAEPGFGVCDRVGFTSWHAGSGVVRFFLPGAGYAQRRNWTTLDSLQGKSDTSESFLDRFNHAFVQSGLSLVQFCKKTGVSRSLFYEIRDGNRAVSDKVWRKLESAEQAAGIMSEEGFGVSHETPKKGSDAESSGSPKEIEEGSNELLPVLLRIANALEALVEIQNRPRTSSEVRGEKSA